ncbi:MAG: SDR family NAD(P)-dependent oxidoreductase, partial [Chloroflexota bacterium]
RIQVAADTLSQETGQTVHAMQLDLGSFESIRIFVDNFVAGDFPPLHALVCNAGLTGTSLQYTQEDIEQIFGVNHLGHFLLVNLLRAHLQEPARIIFVSSGTHLPEHRLARLTGVPKPKYTNALALAYPEKASDADAVTNPFRIYSTSKLCNVLCAYELARQLDNPAIGVFAIDPGLMPDTQLARELPAWAQSIFRGFFMSLRHVVNGIRSVETSGEHVARLVTDEALAGRTALYFDGLEETRSSADSYDEAKGQDLWETSAQLVGLQTGVSV